MMTSIIKQISAKLRKDLYRLNMPFLKGETMVVGIDTVQSGDSTIIGLSASYNKTLTQFYSKVAR